MKKFLQIFFTTLGVIFFLLILGGVYFYVADPYGIKPIIKSFYQQPEPTTKQTSSPTDKNPLLSPTQEQALEKIGIDPAALPTNITPAMTTCFYEKLGTKRANEIKNGFQPTAADYFTARACL
ncbi:MAG: hypothetical protein A2534_01680 [Candidatus Magasanikbacteria bacterium RIFOXYD2_FULL_39_9]|uniref:Uncharacterized protein n=1 Tax=Candidatus Magasanikbacteria bacterium RIFOXYD1_FULL_40_23 TaxID=1798705 RepID=A0A1F6P9P0_9BACT|nr:MAG: hypothetical protein A2534_01680 [Candidatus Magasanikbacteria bacterium RIFOXYD2_FULL_39_9]OGH92828.1 MAG: hypothetical protein A2563_04135 [Candidatus Magasanikbacteria bacterium RIFOXYD1_FULL_40_23]